MQRQELQVKGARGDAKELVELPIPVKYRWVPEGLAPDSRYNDAPDISHPAGSGRGGGCAVGSLFSLEGGVGLRCGFMALKRDAAGGAATALIR
jgi:hypothetical protein